MNIFLKFIFIIFFNVAISFCGLFADKIEKNNIQIKTNSNNITKEGKKNNIANTTIDTKIEAEKKDNQEQKEQEGKQEEQEKGEQEKNIKKTDDTKKGNNLFIKIKNSFEDIVNFKTSITNTSFQQVQEIPKNEKNITFQLKIGGLFDFQYGHAFLNSPYNSSNLNYANGLGFYPQLRYGSNYLSTWQDFNLRTKIDISPEIKFKNFKFGAMFAVPLVKNYDSDPKTASQEYLYIDLDYIKFEFGSTFSAASKMRIDPSLSASGAGGVYGDWWRYSGSAIFNTTGATGGVANALNYGYSPVFMIYPTLPNEAGFTGGGALMAGYSGNLPLNATNIHYAYTSQGLPTQGARSNKISIYSKRIAGVQVGFSYSPDTNNTGFMNRITMNSGALFGGIKNYIAVAVNYKEQFTDLIGLGLSFTFEHGKYYGPTSVYQNASGGNQSSNLSDNASLNKRDLNAFAIGSILIYKNFSFSYAYNNWLNSLTPYTYKNPFGYNNLYTGKHSYSHVGGIGANFGNMNFSIQYMHSNYQGNQANVLSIGTDYILASLRYIRIEPYVEYNFILLKSNSFILTDASNITYQAITKIGHVLIMGVRLRF